MSLQDLWFEKISIVNENSAGGNTEILFPYTRRPPDEQFFDWMMLCLPSTGDIVGHGGLGVYQGLVDAFFMANGLPAKPENGYVEQGFTTGADNRRTVWQGGGPNQGDVTLDHTYNMYAGREPRFYLTVAYHNSWNAGANGGNGRAIDLRLRSDANPNTDNDGTHDAPNNGYRIRKRTDAFDNNAPGGGWRARNGYNLSLYRLAASYLDYAEAANEAEDSATAREEAIKYINLIRERAGIRGYTFSAVPADDPDLIALENSQQAVRLAVRMERRVELCSEGSRWDDIRRWMIAESIPEITGWVQGMNFLGQTEETFLVRTNAGIQPRIWRNQYYWLPIARQDIDEYPTLVQNPGW
jgi:hypothetical protein